MVSKATLWKWENQYETLLVRTLARQKLFIKGQKSLGMEFKWQLLWTVEKVGGAKDSEGRWDSKESLGQDACICERAKYWYPLSSPFPGQKGLKKF